MNIISLFVFLRFEYNTLSLVEQNARMQTYIEIVDHWAKWIFESEIVERALADRRG